LPSKNRQFSSKIPLKAFETGRFAANKKHGHIVNLIFMPLPEDEAARPSH